MITQAIPLLVMLLMFIVGASLNSADIAQVKKQPSNIAILSLGQLLLLPALAALLIVIFNPEPIIKNGLILASISPGGAVSNIYTLLARGNTALSVTLTSCNSLLAIIVIPLLVITIFPWLFGTTAHNELFYTELAKQLFFLLFIPLALGLLCKHYAKKLMFRVMPYLEFTAGLALLSLIAAILIQFKQLIIGQFNSIFVLAMSFSVLSIALAFGLAKWLKLNSREIVAVIIEYPIRNLALTALLAHTLFSRNDYLLFAAVFFVVQTPIILMIMFISRYKYFN